MTPSPQDLQSLVDRGLASLRLGDAAAARAAFVSAAAASPRDANVQLALAHACAAHGDAAAAMAAVDAALALEPRHLRALGFKADRLDAAGDTRAAATYYRAVLSCAPPPERLPPELERLLAHAAAMVERYANRFEAALRGHLAAAAERIGAPSVRVAESLDILVGRRRIFVQQPEMYYFPGLAPIAFFDRHAFPWLDRLEAASAEIRDELRGVLADGAAFAPYVQGDPRRPQLRREGVVDMADNPDWSAYYLHRNGEPVPAHAARCPRTMAALADVPMPRVRARSPSVLFSQLRPGARIPPHHGFTNTRLIVHLPLIVPSGCGFRVGNETREWVEGKAWVFDDTIEHEAWNDSPRTRIVLLFEIWRPELSAAERAQVTALFEAVDAERGGGDWGI